MNKPQFKAWLAQQDAATKAEAKRLLKIAEQTGLLTSYHLQTVAELLTPIKVKTHD